MQIVSKEIISKGWSDDQKYLMKDETGKKYLLRYSELDKYEAKLLEFKMLKRLAKLDLPIAQPIDLSVSDGKVTFIYQWIDGVSVEENIASYSRERQYKYGVEAGEIACKIHSISEPDKEFDWATFFNAKMNRKIKNYKNCPLKYQKGQVFIDYIEEHRHLLNDRPISYQQGDYHVGNMLIDKKGQLYIIDFDRCDFGDPWEEFNRIVWSAMVSPIFASGMLDGYFDNSIPTEFWQLLALYIASDTLSALPWATRFGDKEINTMLDKADLILKWYDDMNCSVPLWYKGKN